MKQDTYSQLRSVDRQLNELDRAHTEAVNKVTVKYQEKRQKLTLERDALLRDISGAADYYVEDLEMAGPAIISPKPPGTIVEPVTIARGVNADGPASE
jgi:hypothetical protein